MWQKESPIVCQGSGIEMQNSDKNHIQPQTIGDPIYMYICINGNVYEFKTIKVFW